MRNRILNLIAVTADGKIFIEDDRAVSVEELTVRLVQWKQKNPRQSFFRAATKMCHMAGSLKLLSSERQACP